MCITTLALHCHPEFPFILIDNRDEDVKRPTGDLLFQDGILRVEDLKSHGTWMGFNTNNGNFAVLTNVEEVISYKRDAITRGELVDLLLRDLQYEETILKDWQLYNGFNLIYGNTKQLQERTTSSIFYLTNRSANNEKHVVLPCAPKKSPLPYQQLYCVSNSTLDDPQWKKVSFLKSNVSHALQQLKTCTSPLSLRDALVECLCQRPHFAADDLPQHLLQEISSNTHLFSNPEAFTCTQQSYYDCSVEHFSNIFVNYQNEYKTVGQTIVLIDKNQHLYYYYRRTDEERFQIPERQPFNPQQEFEAAWQRMLSMNWQSHHAHLFN